MEIKSKNVFAQKYGKNGNAVINEFVFNDFAKKDKSKKINY